MSLGTASVPATMSARRVAGRAVALLSHLRISSSVPACSSFPQSRHVLQNGRCSIAHTPSAAPWQLASPLLRSASTTSALESSDVAQAPAEDLETDNGAVAMAAEAAPPSAEASEPAAEPEEAETPAEQAQPASSSATHREEPLLQQFGELWDQYAEVLSVKGFFNDTPTMRVPNSKRSELGVIKRANLEMARSRIDILYSLPTAKVEALAKAELPYNDRKVCRRMHGPMHASVFAIVSACLMLKGALDVLLLQTDNAKERLVATFVEKRSLGVGNGGHATTLVLPTPAAAPLACCSAGCAAPQLLAMPLAPFSPFANACIDPRREVCGRRTWLACSWRRACRARWTPSAPRSSSPTPRLARCAPVRALQAHARPCTLLSLITVKMPPKHHSPFVQRARRDACGAAGLPCLHHSCVSAGEAQPVPLDVELQLSDQETAMDQRGLYFWRMRRVCARCERHPAGHHGTAAGGAQP